MVRILQHNIQSVRKNKASLEHYTNMILAKIFNYAQKSSNFSITGFNTIIKLRLDLFEGVAITFRQRVQHQTNHDIIIACTKSLQSNITIVSVYLPPSTNGASIFRRRTKRRSKWWFQCTFSNMGWYYQFSQESNSSLRTSLWNRVPNSY